MEKRVWMHKVMAIYLCIKLRFTFMSYSTLTASVEEKMKHDFWWNIFFGTTGHAYFLDVTGHTSPSRSEHTKRQVAATSHGNSSDHSVYTGLATSCSNMLRRHIAATNHFVCTREFLWKSLSPQQNFLAITSCTNSVWFDFLQHVAVTKVCCRDKDFQKNSPVHPKQPVTTCVPTFMLCSTPMTTNTPFLQNFLWLKK